MIDLKVELHELNSSIEFFELSFKMRNIYCIYIFSKINNRFLSIKINTNS
jgi:hypothetical protein